MGHIPSLEDCKPGISPVEYNVVVIPEQVETKTAGGIILPDQKKDQDAMASMRGRLLAVSPLAFNYDEWPEGAEKPKAGNAVLFAKYGGVLIEGADGKEYRVLKDRDIMAILS